MRYGCARISKSIVAFGVFGVAVGLLAGLNVLISALPSPGLIVGVVDDWSTHHVVFTNPGTAAEALAQGRFKDWYRTVNDPRYIMQQMKRNPLAHTLSGATDFASRMALLSAPTASSDVLSSAKTASPGTLTNDWNVDVGPIGVGGGNYPAKFSFNSAPSCSDIAIFNTSEAGSTTTATVMGINNLYDGAPSGELSCTGSPTVAFAYDTSDGDATDKVVTSATFSLAGTEIAFVSTDGTHSYLNLLRFETGTGNGTAYAHPVAPATISTTGAGYVSCKSGTGSCLLRLEFSDSGDDTISSPYYDYSSDTLWAGDASGNLHEFQPVFNGDAVEVGAPWAKTGATTVLASPVYDGTYVYVGGANGILYAFTASSGALKASSATLTHSGSLGLIDAPLLDVVNSVLYVAMGDDPSGDSSVMQLPTPALTPTSEVYFGTGSTTVPEYVGTFDNTHYAADLAGANTTGYITTCNFFAAANYFNPIKISGFSAGRKLYSSVSGDVYERVSNAAVACSPQTENVSGGHDYIFLSVASHADTTGTAPSGCANGTADACLYSFIVGTSTGYTWTTAASPNYGFKIPENTGTASSTSAIIVDNSAANGSNIYFTTNATTNGAPCTTTTAGCAIQVTQAAP